MTRCLSFPSSAHCLCQSFAEPRQQSTTESTKITHDYDLFLTASPPFRTFHLSTSRSTMRPVALKKSA